MLITPDFFAKNYSSSYPFIWHIQNLIRPPSHIHVLLLLILLLYILAILLTNSWLKYFIMNLVHSVWTHNFIFNPDSKFTEISCNFQGYILPPDNITCLYRTPYIFFTINKHIYNVQRVLFGLSDLWPLAYIILLPDTTDNNKS